MEQSDLFKSFEDEHSKILEEKNRQSKLKLVPVNQNSYEQLYTIAQYLSRIPAKELNKITNQLAHTVPLSKKPSQILSQIGLYLNYLPPHILNKIFEGLGDKYGSISQKSQILLSEVDQYLKLLSPDKLAKIVQNVQNTKKSSGRPSVYDFYPDNLKKEDFIIELQIDILILHLIKKILESHIGTTPGEKEIILYHKIYVNRDFLIFLFLLNY